MKDCRINKDGLEKWDKSGYEKRKEKRRIGEKKNNKN